jgi:integrase
LLHDGSFHARIAIALLISRDVHVKVVQERAGHSDSGFTMNVYGHALPTLGRAAAESLGPLFRKLNRAG